MNKFYLVIRIILLVALFFLLASVFWGLAQRKSTQIDGDTKNYERNDIGCPAGYTSVILIILVVLGIFAVLVSIFFEYYQVRKERMEPGSGGRGELRG
ncbi:MAG: hypothetical protein SWK76_08040 [Actinomycetota bacterium]|nr:hypothetical protein [Actinomycetota bacterium]